MKKTNEKKTAARAAQILKDKTLSAATGGSTITPVCRSCGLGNNPKLEI